MNEFVKLSVRDQAAIVLITLLDQVVKQKRSKTSVENASAELFEFLSTQFRVPESEVLLVAKEVANGGLRMLPGYEEPQSND